MTGIYLWARPQSLIINIYWRFLIEVHRDIYGDQKLEGQLGGGIFIILSGWWENRLVSLNRITLFENFFPGSNWKINFSSEGHKCSSYLRKFQINKRDFSSEKVLFTILGTSLESTLLLMMEILLKVQTLTLARQTWIKISFRGGMVWGRKREKRHQKSSSAMTLFPLLFSPSFSSI